MRDFGRGEETPRGRLFGVSGDVMFEARHQAQGGDRPCRLETRPQMIVRIAIER